MNSVTACQRLSCTARTTVPNYRDGERPASTSNNLPLIVPEFKAMLDVLSMMMCKSLALVIAILVLNCDFYWHEALKFKNIEI